MISEQPPQFNVYRHLLFMENGCVEWLGGYFLSGYPKIKKDGKVRRAHRWFYEQCVGAIPAGQQLHHTCRNKRCVYPGHLEPLSALEHRRAHPEPRNYRRNVK